MGSPQRQQVTSPASTWGRQSSRSCRWSWSYPRWAVVRWWVSQYLPRVAVVQPGSAQTLAALGTLLAVGYSGLGGCGAASGGVLGRCGFHALLQRLRDLTGGDGLGHDVSLAVAFSAALASFSACVMRSARHCSCGVVLSLLSATVPPT